MPGAEVVERDAHADAREVGEQVARGLAVLHEHRLGQLDVHALGGDAVFAQRVLDERGQVRVAHLARGEIDGHAQRRQAHRVPGGELRAGRADHPRTHRQHEARLLEHADEAVRGHHAAAGCMPADQRLDTGDDAVGQARLGLVVQQELLAFDRAAQGHFERQPRRHRGIEVFAKEAIDAAAQRLGPVHRHVGVAHEPVEVDIVARVHRDADADRNHHLLLAEKEGRVERVEQALSNEGGIVGTTDVLGDDGELVAAQAGDGERTLFRGAGHGVDLAQAARQHRGDLLQQAVASLVPEAVVDHLEAVEVQEHQGHVAAAAPRALHGALQSAAKERSIGQPGEAVVVGQAHEAVLCLAAVADVAQAHQPVAAGRRGARQLHELDLDRHLAMLAMNRGLAVAQRRAAVRRRRLLDMAAAGRPEQVRRRTLHQAAGGVVAGDDHASRVAQQQGVVTAGEQGLQPALGQAQAPFSGLQAALPVRPAAAGDRVGQPHQQSVTPAARRFGVRRSVVGWQKGERGHGGSDSRYRRRRPRLECHG